MKKNSTQVIDLIEAAETDDDGRTILEPHVVALILKKLRAIDARDEQKQKPRKKTRTTRATTRSR